MLSRSKHTSWVHGITILPKWLLFPFHVGDWVCFHLRWIIARFTECVACVSLIAGVWENKIWLTFSAFQPGHEELHGTQFWLSYVIGCYPEKKEILRKVSTAPVRQEQCRFRPSSQPSPHTSKLPLHSVRTSKLRPSAAKQLPRASAMLSMGLVISSLQNGAPNNTTKEKG